MFELFFVGLDHPEDARHFDRACISINARGLRKRKQPIGPCEVLLDSGAFSEIALHGHYRRKI
jgi:hypothetical protein